MPTIKAGLLAARVGQKTEYKWSMAGIVHKSIVGEHKANINSQEVHVLMEVQEEPVEGQEPIR